MLPSFGSLFAGIGGIDLGLERAGWTCKWQVEINPFCQAVLKKHWPEVPKFGDVRKLSGKELSAVELIAGGFPCQPVSVAGKRRGKEDPRWLWPQFARIISILRPPLVFVENTPGLFQRGFSEVLGGLAANGYNAEWDCLEAKDIGAPHRRRRIFIVAYASQIRLREAKLGLLQRKSNAKGRTTSDITGNRLATRESRGEGISRDNARPEDYAAAFANSEEIGRISEKPTEVFVTGKGGMGHERCAGSADYGLQRVQRVFEGEISRFKEFSWCENVRRVEDFSGRPDIPEPLFRGSRDGIPNWVDRIASLGNAVVPQISQWIGERMLEVFYN